MVRMFLHSGGEDVGERMHQTVLKSCSVSAETEFFLAIF